MECSSSTLFVIQRIWLSLCIRTCDSLRVQVTRLAMGLLCQHAKGNQVVFKGQGLGWEFEGKSGNEGSEDNGHELEAIFKEDFLGGKFQILPRQRPCQAYSLRFPTAMGSLTWAACTRDLRFIVLTEKIRLRLPYPRSQRVAFTTIRDTSETLETRQTSFLSEKKYLCFNLGSNLDLSYCLVDALPSELSQPPFGTPKRQTFCQKQA